MDKITRRPRGAPLGTLQRRNRRDWRRPLSSNKVIAKPWGTISRLMGTVPIHSSAFSRTVWFRQRALEYFLGRGHRFPSVAELIGDARSAEGHAGAEQFCRGFRELQPGFRHATLWPYNFRAGGGFGRLESR